MKTVEQVPSRLVITLSPHVLPLFASLLQHGLLFPISKPIELATFLLSLPGFTPDYLEQTVQTIFVDGVAADSLDKELAGGSTVALSAAMPGLAGAIFRRHGMHGSLRSRPASVKHATSEHGGYVTLKLFNSIASDRVKDLLTRSILVHGQAFRTFAEPRPHLFQPDVCSCLFNDTAMDYSSLLAATATCSLLQIQVELHGSVLPEPGSRHLTAA